MKHFIDANRNYYETTDSIDTPDGHSSVVQRPSLDHIREDGEWVYVDPGVDLTRNLTRAEFNGMMAGKELDVIWSDMQAALKGVPGEEAAASRAALAANLHAKFYNLEATLKLVGEFRDFAATLNPDYAAMLTDDSITAAWRATVARRDGVTS